MKAKWVNIEDSLQGNVDQRHYARRIPGNGEWGGVCAKPELSKKTKKAKAEHPTAKAFAELMAETKTIMHLLRNSVLALCLLPAWLFAQETAVLPDRPGMGTGTTVLGRGLIQWETEVAVAHAPGMHELVLPNTLFRFGVDKRAELRLEYEGSLFLSDRPSYAPSPLKIGSKLMIWGGSEEKNLRWIPRTSLMLNLGVPVSRALAEVLPVSGSIDLLFESDITNWLSLGYNFGTHWREWAPAPDLFASLALNFTPTEHFNFYVESYNYFDCDVDKDVAGYSTGYDINLNFGVMYFPHPRWQLDAYAGFNCYASEPALSSPKNYAFLGIGVSWLIYAPEK